MIFKLNVGRFKIGISLFREGKKDVYGYTNRCSDGKFIVFLDYDDISLEWVYNEVRHLQVDFNLGDFFLFQSNKDSYHAVSFSKVTLKELMRVLLNSSIDENYHRIPYTIGKKLLTLRLSKKDGRNIRFLCCLKNNSNRLESKEHKELFNNLFPSAINKKQMRLNNDYGHPTDIICSHYKIQ